MHRHIWTDEKFFVFDQKPYRKREGKWSNSNPFEKIETNDRNGVKAMIFVANVNGKFPILNLLIDEIGSLDFVNRLK